MTEAEERQLCLNCPIPAGCQPHSLRCPVAMQTNAARLVDRKLKRALKEMRRGK